VYFSDVIVLKMRVKSRLTDMSKWVSTIVENDTARSRYTETFYNWSIQLRRGHYRIVETYIHMNMAINMYEYGRGGICVYMFRYTYAGIRETKMQMEKEERHMSRVMRTSTGTVT